MTQESPFDVAVVGSANLDFVVTVPHHPVTGETVLGGDHEQFPGGKGANQAVAGARLGARVAFIGMVGSDGPGISLRQSLEDAQVNTDGLGTADVASGIALITVDAQGDNAITVSPGANALVSKAVVDEMARTLEATVTQLQLEIPMETVIYAAQKASGIVVLDPAPAPSTGIPDELLAAIDVIAPNETELALLAGRSVDPTDVEDIERAAKGLAVETVVVTLGANGAVVVTNEGAVHVEAPTIEPVDTTAAGDAFRSALSVGLAAGDSIVEAAEFAVRVGAATTMEFGAQPSLPSREQVAERLS